MKSKICPICKKKFTGNWAKSVISPYCSSYCARKVSSLSNRSETNKKVSEILKKRYEDAYNKSPKHCPICNELIPYELRSRKSCCKHECVEALKLQTMAERGVSPKDRKTPFVENGQGRSKSGRYKGFFCNSTYELAYYIYCIDHGISIERNTKKYKYVYNGKEHYYIPDFRVNGKLTEIKGYCNEQVKAKLAAVDDESIDILYIEDLQPMMDYIDATYGCKHTGSRNNYAILFEDYKPRYRYKYVCDYCKTEFETNTRYSSKCNHRFCNNKCYVDYKKSHKEEFYKK